MPSGHKRHPAKPFTSREVKSWARDLGCGALGCSVLMVSLAKPAGLSSYGGAWTLLYPDSSNLPWKLVQLLAKCRPQPPQPSPPGQVAAVWSTAPLINLNAEALTASTGS